MILAPNTWRSVACVQFNCSSCVEQFANGSAVFWVTGHFSTPPENWTVRAFLHLSNDFTAAWLTFTFSQLFAVAANLKSIDYNVAMTFILNNIKNNNNTYNWRQIGSRSRSTRYVPFPMTFSDPRPKFQRHATIRRWVSQKRYQIETQSQWTVKIRVILSDCRIVNITRPLHNRWASF